MAGWHIEASLHESGGELRVGLVATKDGPHGKRNTSDFVAVIDEADARREARAFAHMLNGSEEHVWSDDRAAA